MVRNGMMTSLGRKRRQVERDDEVDGADSTSDIEEVDLDGGDVNGGLNVDDGMEVEEVEIVEVEPSTKRRRDLRGKRGLSLGAGAARSTGRSGGPITGRIGRTLNEYQGFKKGNIVRLVMKNFLTFSNVALTPGPKMNLILGPNGTGKSTIVNAICIVFGGSLKLLGRNPNLASYIRHGERVAKLEVHVYDPEARSGVRKICREINSAGKTTCYLEGERVIKKRVDELGKRYDIQLDNLCQFMPQEKISSFSTLRPCDLMSMTVRALGGTKKLEEYNDLITSFLTASSDNNLVDERRKGLEVLVKKNQAVQHEVEAYQDQKKIRERIKNMERFRYWVEAMELNADTEEAKEAFASGKSEVDAKIAELSAKQGPLLKLQREKASVTASYKAGCARVTSADEDLQKHLHEFEQSTTKIKLEKKELENLDKDHEVLAKKLKFAELQVQKARDELAEQRDTAELDREAQEYRENKRTIKKTQSSLSAQIADEQANISEIGRKINSLQATIKELKDVKSRRLQRLDREYPGLAKCYWWIRKNADQFRGPVHGPVFLEMNVETMYHARVLDQAVPRWLMAAFVVENEEDHKRIINYGKLSEGGAKPHVISVNRNRGSQGGFRSPAPITHLSQLGIYTYATEIYSAIDPIKEALNIHVGLYSIAVGDRRSLHNTQALIDQRVLDRWFTPESMYNVVSSRYDRNSRSTKISNLRDRPSYLRPEAGGDESGQIAGLQRQLQMEEGNLEQALAKLEELKNRHASFEPQIRNMEAELYKLTNEKRKIESAKYKLEQQIRNLKFVQESIENDDVDARKEQLRQKIAMIESKAPKMLLSVVKGVKRLKDLIAKVDALVVTKCQVDNKYEKENKCKSDTDEAIRELQEGLLRQKNNVKALKAQAKAKAAEATTHLDFAKLKEKEFQELPRSLEELDDLIVADRARAQARSGATRDVVENYERRLKQIETLENQLAEDVDRCRQKRENLHRRKDEFVKWLNDKVKAMSKTFTRLYKNLECSGDLVLRNAESMGETYVDIMVAYREDEKMRPLNKSVHSGGERMVATMLYHFAMQSLTKAPFRVIDEMNQGMDSDNERKILAIMMKDAENDEVDAPQSFLITPKLLLDLPFNASTVSHVIINGNMKC
eukprot:Plantae.Rhodophyta-Hildenbrandia_rubra.ctg719.p1 GENE.Plantae.Rhodophyta-Hildenbrandia_rubra.ctg719~~Plantae.Rhodophyta-Hildenbrandia_rubra.ctg719.p1  ORF type:complete len:1131 (-),score=237.21 Plantae.Rhodophyta-Hildenbrandia_rubra.ctg719:1971-5363(-)